MILCTVLPSVSPGLDTTYHHGTARLLGNLHVRGRRGGVPAGWNEGAGGPGDLDLEFFLSVTGFRKDFLFTYLKVHKYAETTTGAMLELVEVAPGRTVSIPPISVATSRPWSPGQLLG